MIDLLEKLFIFIFLEIVLNLLSKREKFTEKVCFRLTWLLIKAMEVTGVDGDFRVTCKTVLSLLRKNKESILDVLEPFVYDPLAQLDWLTRTQQGN